jgi:hypothetical protein
MTATNILLGIIGLLLFCGVWELGNIVRCLRWQIDYARDPERTKRREP